MADIVEFPIAKQVEAANRGAALSPEPRIELLTKLQLLMINAADINNFPPCVMDTVRLGVIEPTFHVWGIEQMLEQAEREIWKARHSLAEYRLAKQRLLKE